MSKVMKNRTYTQQIDVRTNDFALNNHVNYAVFYTYFEECLKHFLADLMPDRQWQYLIAHSECDYKASILCGDKPQTTLTVVKIGNKSITVKYLITERSGTKKTYAKGKTVFVNYDFATGKIVPVDAGMRSALEEYVKP